MCIKPERDTSGRLVSGTANPRGASVPRARLARLLAQAEKLGAEVVIRLPVRPANDEPNPVPPPPAVTA